MVKTTSRGFSFVEVSLIMGMTLGILTLVGMFFSRGQRYAAETRTYAEAQSAATSLLRKMSDNLYRCSYEQRQIASGCAFFLSHAPLENDSKKLELSYSGQIAWKKWLGYRFDSTNKTIYQGELPLRDFHYDLTIAPTTLIDAETAATNPSISWKPLPGKVRNFSIGTADQRVRVRMTTEALTPIAGSQAEREITVSVSGEIALYN